MGLGLYRIEYKFVCSVLEKEADELEKSAVRNDESNPCFFDEEEISKLKKYRIKEATDYVIF